MTSVTLDPIMKKIIFTLSLLFTIGSSATLADTYSGVYADTNNQILPGFTLLSTAINGT